MKHAPPPATPSLTVFIVRLGCDPAGGPITGIVERVRTGEKARFHDLSALAAVIGRLLAADGPSGPSTPSVTVDPDPARRTMPCDR